MPTLGQTFNRSALRKGVNRSAPLAAGGDRLHLNQAIYTLDAEDTNWDGFTVEEQIGSSLSAAGTKINIAASGVYAITLRIRCADWLDTTKILTDVYSDVGPFEVIDEFLKSDVISYYSLSATWAFDEGDFLTVNSFGNGNQSPLNVSLRLLAVRLG